MIATVNKGFEFTSRKAQNDTQISLWDLVERWKTGRLVPAPHQRTFTWTQEKVNEWAKTIIEASSGDYAERPTGFMVTYQVPFEDTTFLNDGLQRLTATLRFLEDCRKYKLTPEQAAQLLINFDMPVQHRHYRSHERAMIQFQRINFGTSLTNAEFCAGFLGQLEESDTNWQPTLQDMQAWMYDTLRDFPLPQRLMKMETWSLFKRHDYVLFYLYLSRSKKLGGDFSPLGIQGVRLIDAEKGRTIEQVLRRQLEIYGISRVLDEFDSYKSVINDELTIIKDVWDTFPHQPHHKLTTSLVRYLLTIALWRKNNKVPAEAWKAFLSKLLPRTVSGAAVIYYTPEDVSKEHPLRKTLGVSQFGSIGSVSATVGSSFYQDIINKQGQLTQLKIA